MEVYGMSALNDEFQQAFSHADIDIPGRIQVVGVFADLIWDADSPPIESLMADPAFCVVGRTRYVALQRVRDEIRYFAAPIQHPSDFTRDVSPEDLKAILAEPDKHRMGVLPSLDDAVQLVLTYLSGGVIKEDHFGPDMVFVWSRK